MDLLRIMLINCSSGLVNLTKIIFNLMELDQGSMKTEQLIISNHNRGRYR